MKPFRAVAVVSIASSLASPPPRTTEQDGLPTQPRGLTGDWSEEGHK